MHRLAVPTAALLLTSIASWPTAFGHGGGSTGHAGGSAPHAAMAHAVAAQHHAMAAQQHAYEHAMHQQMMVQQHMIQQYQRSVHEQLQAQIRAHAAAANQPHHPATTVASSPPRSSLPGVYPLVASGYLNSPHHYYSSSRHYYHRYYHHHHRPYRHHRAWPGSTDTEYAALQHLRQTLDQVPALAAGARSGSSHRGAIDQALQRVVEVTQPPSLAAIDRLAGDIEEALLSRTQPAINTTTLALALRGGVNYSALIAAERVEVVHELEATLKQGGVPPQQVAAVVASLRNVERQEIAMHAHR